MADLLTHVALALLVKRGQRLLRPAAGLHGGSFLLGTLLPDALGRGAPALVSVVARPLGGAPGLLQHGWEAFHLPAGMVLTSALLAVWFAPRQRLPVFGNLLGGMLLHLGVDLLQDHAGGGYLLLFPLSTRPFELGWVGTEASTIVAPWLALAAAWAWWPRWRRGPSAAREEG